MEWVFLASIEQGPEKVIMILLESGKNGLTKIDALSLKPQPSCKAGSALEKFSLQR